jgi:hypothetical protein
MVCHPFGPLRTRLSRKVKYVAAEEPARLAKAAGHPVAVHCTRAKEFTWAYFGPAAVIEWKGGLDDKAR